MRWKQSLNKETGKHEFIPIDESARTAAQGAIHGDIQTFVSPVGGSVISDRKQLREHNKRNNVVSADNFSPEFIARKTKERERVLNGEHTPQESFKRKQELYNHIIRAEREG